MAHVYYLQKLPRPWFFPSNSQTLKDFKDLWETCILPMVAKTDVVEWHKVMLPFTLFVNIAENAVVLFVFSVCTTLRQVNWSVQSEHQSYRLCLCREAAQNVQCEPTQHAGTLKMQCLLRCCLLRTTKCIHTKYNCCSLFCVKCLLCFGFRHWKQKHRNSNMTPQNVVRQLIVKWKILFTLSINLEKD